MFTRLSDRCGNHKFFETSSSRKHARTPVETALYSRCMFNTPCVLARCSVLHTSCMFVGTDVTDCKEWAHISVDLLKKLYENIRILGTHQALFFYAVCIIYGAHIAVSEATLAISILLPCSDMPEVLVYAMFYLVSKPRATLWAKHTCLKRHGGLQS